MSPTFWVPLVAIYAYVLPALVGKCNEDNPVHETHNKHCVTNTL